MGATVLEAVAVKVKVLLTTAPEAGATSSTVTGPELCPNSLAAIRQAMEPIKNASDSFTA